MSTNQQHNTKQLNSIRTGPRGGAPVILVHPVGLDLTYWDTQIEALRPVYDVIAFDLPGHGLSPGRPEDLRFSHLADVTAELIAASSVGPAHVVGISVGGMVAQTLALAHPQLVRSLTLIATAPTFSEAGRAALRARADAIRNGGMNAVLTPSIERWFTSATVAHRPHLIDRITKTLLRDDPEIQAAMWAMIAELDVLDRLGEMRCPTRVLVGDRDTSTPPAVSELLAGRIVDATMRILPNASHLIHLEIPEAINTELLAFFARC